MARRYLLPCGQCDQKIVIETTQAGQTVTCSGCQNQIKIGTLRDIRALTSAEAESSMRTIERKSEKMSAANRAVFVISLIVLAVGLFWGISSLMKALDLQSKVVDASLSDDKVRNLTAVLEAESPSTMLDRWSEVSENMVAEWKEDVSLKNRRLADSYQFYAWIAFGMASIGLLGIIGAMTIKGAKKRRG